MSNLRLQDYPGLLLPIPAVGGNITTVGLYASLPGAPASNGDTYQCSDGPYKFVGVAGAWQAFLKDQAVGVPGPSGGWTQVNFGGKVTLSDTGGSVNVAINDTATANLRLITKNITATPFHREAFLKAALITANSTLLGHYFYNGTKAMGLEFLVQASGAHSMCVAKWTNVTTRSTVPFTTSTAFIAGPQFGGIWTRLGYDGTNVTFDWALERGDWRNLWSETAATFIVPTQYGVGGECVTTVGTNNIFLAFQADTLTP